jgi:hypothetical protein
MMYRFSSFVLALLLLVASGQAFAVTCTTAADGALDAIAVWGGTTAGTADCATAADWTMSTAADDITIDHALTTPGANVAAKTVAINAGGGLTLGAKTLTISGNFTNAATAATDVNLATSTVAFATNAATVGGTAATTFNHLSITGAALTLPSSTSSAMAIVEGNFTFGTGGTLAAGSVLKLAATGNHVITAPSGGSTIPSLDLSAATAAKTITSATGPLTLTGVVWPTDAAAVINFTAGASAAITLTIPAASTASCVVGTTPIAAGTYTLAAGSTSDLVCTPYVAPSVSAPIFSTKEKAAVFTEEVKH